MLLLSLSIMTVSCTKGNPSNSISGTWQKYGSKMPASDNPTEAQKFVSNFTSVVFSGNSVIFKDANNEVIGKGTFSYNVTQTIDMGSATNSHGTISFDGVPLKGGDFSKTGDVISWNDVDDILLGLIRQN